MWFYLVLFLTLAGSDASSCCSWLFPEFAVVGRVRSLVLLVGEGAYCMQLEPWGEEASPEAAPWAGDMVVVALTEVDEDVVVVDVKVEEVGEEEDDDDGDNDEEEEDEEEHTLPLWWFSVCLLRDRASQ